MEDLRPLVQEFLQSFEGDPAFEYPPRDGVGESFATDVSHPPSRGQAAFKVIKDIVRDEKGLIARIIETREPR